MGGVAEAAGSRSWAFTQTVPPPAAGHPDRYDRPQVDPRPDVAARLEDLTASLRRLVGRLGDPQARQLEQMLVELAHLSAALTGCCHLLEADAAGRGPRAARRMVQASGHAEALVTRLADVIDALRVAASAPAGYTE